MWLENQNLRIWIYPVCLVIFTMLCSTIACADDTTTLLNRDGLLLEYKFESDTTDTSGCKRDGSLVGNPKFIEGRVEQCLKLDGNGSYLNMPLTSAELGQVFTVECWVKPDAQQNLYANIFGFHDHGGIGFVLQQDSANANQYAANYGTGMNRWVLTRPVQLTANKWQHVAMIKTLEPLTLYFNGMPVASVPASDPMVTSPIPLRVGLGFNGPERCFRGCIDEFRVWNRVVTEFNLDLSEEEKFMPIAESLCIEWRNIPPALGMDKNAYWEFSLPAEFTQILQEQPQNIEVTLKAMSWANNRTVHLPDIALLKQSSFKAKVNSQLPPGAYTITATPFIMSDGMKIPGKSCKFTWLSEGPVIMLEPIKVGTITKESDAKISSQKISLDSSDWKIATDPDNSGRDKKWFDAPPSNTRLTKVPWIIQDIFPDYHGVVWYWREFDAPENPHLKGHSLLRFEAVDYLAEVWVNGKPVGSHEGSETPFELDVSDAIRPEEKNLLAVRILNPTNEPIDGIVLSETARSCKLYPVTPGAIYNVGGIVDSVYLLLKPALWIEDVYVVSDWKTGAVSVQSDVFNSTKKSTDILMRFCLTDARSGDVVAQNTFSHEMAPNATRLQADLTVLDHHLWQLDDPVLYRATVEILLNNGSSSDVKAVHFGFRDFRYENNAFRLNGKRIYLQGALILPIYPVGFRCPLEEDYVRREVMAYKAMGLNTCRIIWGGLRARDLDIFDELGVLVQQEHYGAIQITPSPEMEDRFDQSITGVMRRDRNHPSIVTWCILNEMWDGPQFRHAVNSLPMLKSLDDTRLVWLNSGGFDMDFSQGSLSNPGIKEWQHLMGSEVPGGPTLEWSRDYGQMLNNSVVVKGDIHPYQPVPHTKAEINRMRTLGERAGDRKILISEIGTGCAINLPRFTRLYEQIGAEYADDARYYRDKLDQFMVDWNRWDLGRIWTRPEDFFENSELNMLKLRRETGNALRANPYLAGYYFCALPDSDFDGCGLLNLFREYKPGVIELQTDLTSPVRWSLFVDPVNIYSGSNMRLEVVLSNLDALQSGDYPVRVEVVAPGGQCIFEKNLTIQIPEPTQSFEPPLVQSVFSDEVSINGPTGVYKLIAYFEHGAAATGECIEFRVYDVEDMPVVTGEVVLWGKDEKLAKWLADNGFHTRTYSSTEPLGRELIIVGNGGGDADAFRELVGRISSGSTVVFLSTAVLASGDQPLARLPLAVKGALAPVDFCGGYYRGDTFALQNPVFSGLPSGGILDYTVYRNIIPQGGISICGLQTPDDLIVAGIRAQFGYDSGILLAGYQLGAGRFMVNTLRICENLGQDPVAEYLLRNLLNYAAPDLTLPVVELPANFDQQLKAIGYE